MALAPTRLKRLLLPPAFHVLSGDLVSAPLIANKSSLP
jgi:hypothetical protein